MHKLLHAVRVDAWEDLRGGTGVRGIQRSEGTDRDNRKISWALQKKKKKKPPFVGSVVIHMQPKQWPLAPSCGQNSSKELWCLP